MKVSGLKTAKPAQKRWSTQQLALIALASTLVFSLILGIAVSELVISRLYPQNTYKIALTGVLSVFKKSDLIPFELKANAQSYNIAPTHEYANDISINSLGFRGKDFNLKKAKNTFRILMLGDSTTFGVGSNDNQTFPFLLQEFLQDQDQPIEVINAGFASGLSPDTYYLYLKEKGLKLQPDLVFVNLFLANDISDLFENEWTKLDSHGLPKKIVSKERQIDSAGRLVFRQKDWKYRLPIIRNMHVGILSLNLIEQKLPRLEKLIRFLVNAPDLLEEIPNEEQVLCLYKNQCSQRFEEQWNRFDLVLKGFKDIAQQANTPVVITLMPAPFQLTAHRDQVEDDYKIDVIIPREDQQNQNYPQLRIIATLNQLGLDYFDLLKGVRTGQNPEYSDKYVYPIDGHFTPQGNAEIARAYQDYLLNHQLLP